jgi:hypothetical protein
MQPTPVATQTQPTVSLRAAEKLLTRLSLTAPALTLLLVHLFLPTCSLAGDTITPLINPRSA